jgi:hypothetical protein
MNYTTVYLEKEHYTSKGVGCTKISLVRGILFDHHYNISTKSLHCFNGRAAKDRTHYGTRTL